MSRAVAFVIAFASLVPVVASAQASATPSTTEIIQQLTPRTRGLTRNLQVESVPAPDAAKPAEGGNAAAPAAPGTAPASPSTTAAASPTAPVDAPVERPSVSLLIHFGFDSARVEPVSREALRNLAEAMRSPQLADASFSIEGHTDAKGSADYNLKLSQRRAAAVLDELARLGVEKSRLSSVGKGFSEPANPLDPLDASNRRVRIVNLQ